MNIMQMMKQAQNLQTKMKATQEELANIEVSGEAGSGAVTVTFDGQGKFKAKNHGRKNESFNRRNQYTGIVLE